MGNQILFFLCLLLLPSVTHAQELPLPEQYVVIDSIWGDLDKDGIAELVVACDMPLDTVYDYVSNPRDLRIFKQVNGQWELWTHSEQVLLGSQDGGMMGDPLAGMEIVKGILIISQNGGSSWKWGFTDKYRFQNGAFYLIGYTSSTGHPCYYWEDIDFNLSTGKVNLQKEYYSCEGGDQEEGKIEKETFRQKGILITLQNRREQEVNFVSPKYGIEVYMH
ncbi:MAG: hypothetical protein KDC34_19290 [Saprospiraceae bacterium]|nr:hypothetical protein [Saprospiraceae bacterium]